MKEDSLSPSCLNLIPLKNIPRINLLLHVVQHGVVAVGYDAVGEAFELGEVIDDPGSEEGGAVLEGGFVDDHLGALGLDAFHDALDGALAEIVGVRLHRETVHPDGHFPLMRGVVSVCP